MIDLSAIRNTGTSLAVASAILLLAMTAALASSVDVYEITGVAVDKTAETAATARDQALAEGEVTAFQRLLRRLTLTRDHGRLPDLPRDELTEFIKDFSVSNEKTSAVRYLATLTFRFKREAVRQLLEDFNIAFAETPSKSVLVLPVYQAAGALSLWDDPNPWRQAWTGNSLGSGIVPMVTPLGDLKDVGAIGPRQAVEGDRPRLNAIAGRYDVQDVVVAYGQLRLDAAVARQGLQVDVTRYGADPEPMTYTLDFRQEENEGLAEFLMRTAHAVAEEIEDQWKQENLLRLDRPAVAAVAVPITGLRDWLSVSQRLNDVPLIRRTEMVLMSLDEVRVNLHYVGEPEQLRVALGQADLTLVREDDEWVLYLADVLPAGDT